MDENEREVHALQHKDRVDLNERQAIEWGKFLQRKNDYAQKYGASYANVLLKKEREDLEAKFSQAHKDLDQDHNKQWLDHHENESQNQPTKLPSFLTGDRREKVQSIDSPSIDTQPRDNLYSNPFNDQKASSPAQVQNIDQSQDYMNAMRARVQNAQKKENEVIVDNKPISFSTRFSMSLGYTQASENSKTSPFQSRDQQPDKDRD